MFRQNTGIFCAPARPAWRAQDAVLSWNLIYTYGDISTSRQETVTLCPVANTVLESTRYPRYVPRY